MTILYKAIARSLGTTLFIALVSTGVLGLLAIPAVGQLFGPVICADQETMVYETYSWSSGGESGTDVIYFCESTAGEREEVSFWRLLVAGAGAWYGLVLVVVWPLLSLRRYVKWSGEERLKREGVETLARIVAVEQTNVRINNQPLFKITFEIHPMNRQAYEVSRRMRVPYALLPQIQPGGVLMVLVDPADPEKVLIELDKLSVAPAARRGQEPPHGRVARLEALKEMRDKGLIERDEYERKKAEILDEL